MEANNENQINQLKKVLLSPLLFIIIIVILFITSHLLKLQYYEHFKYGRTAKGFVTDIYWKSSGDSPPTSLFYCKIKAGGKNYIYEIQNADQSSMLSTEEEILIEEIKNNDKVKIKILNEKYAKILEWKKLKINPINKIQDILGIWLIISVLLSIVGFLIYKIYNLYKI